MSMSTVPAQCSPKRRCIVYAEVKAQRIRRLCRQSCARQSKLIECLGTLSLFGSRAFCNRSIHNDHARMYRFWAHARFCTCHFKCDMSKKVSKLMVYQVCQKSRRRRLHTLCRHEQGHSTRSTENGGRAFEEEANQVAYFSC